MSTNEGKTTPKTLAELRSLVFGNVVLREKIVGFVVHDGENVSSTDVMNCRLVHSSWLEAVSTCFRHSRTPLFTLMLPPKFEQKSIANFDLMTTSFLNREGVQPTVGITIRDTYFNQEGYQKVVDLLLSYQSGLVRLHMHIPVFGILQALDTEGLYFPLLRKLHVRCSYSRNMLHGQPREYFDYVKLFIHPILEGSPNLKQVIITGGLQKFACLPTGLENLPLPRAITNLELDCQLTNTDLQNSLSFRLPLLTNLLLQVGLVTVEPSLISQLLTKFCDTLKKLTLEGSEYYETSSLNLIEITLPNMRHLQTLELTNGSFEVEGFSQNQLPTLKNIKLSNIRYRTMLPCIKDAHFESVEEFNFIVNGREGAAEAFIAACRAFPNVLKLNLHFRLFPTRLSSEESRNICWAQYDVLQMKILKTIWRGGKPDGNSWIAYLHKDASATDSDFLNAVWSSLRPPTELTTLTKLRKLHLSYDCGYPLPFDDVLDLMLSHMPNLEEVCLKGKFEVSMKTIRKWNKSGRLLRMMP